MNDMPLNLADAATVQRLADAWNCLDGRTLLDTIYDLSYAGC